MTDMAGLLAIEEAVRTGGKCTLQTPPRSRHPDAALLRNFAPTTKRFLIS